MTVRELIEYLSTLPGEWPVVDENNQSVRSLEVVGIPDKKLPGIQTGRFFVVIRVAKEA